MKKINIIVLSLFLIGLSACDLNRYPFNTIEQSQAFQTVKDATTLDNAFYSQLRGRVYGIYIASPDIQTDLWHGSLDWGNRRGSVHRWDFISDDYDIRDIWSGYYGALSNVNNFLDNVDKIVTTSTTESDSINGFKGEAHFFRAYYHEKLVKRFAKDYEPASAATDPGVPIVTHFDLNEKPPRASIADVYAQILSDIAEAKALLKRRGSLGASRVTLDAVTALEARVYLDTHKYTEAVNAANTLINSGTYPLVNTEAALRSLWTNDATSETIFLLFASQPSELSSAMNYYLGYSAANRKYTPDFIPEKWIVDLYDDADIRKAVYFAKLPTFIQGKDYELYLFNKFPGNPTLFTAANSNYQHRPKVFRIAEAHLIKAEALAWSGDDPNALAALNVLRTNRGLAALSGLTGDNLKKEIKNERTRELLGEGGRLDDLKRWKQGVQRGVPQEATPVVSGPSGSELNKPANDDKFVWAIPSRDILTNPNLKDSQNPGW
jgi:hypothetical protein